MIMKNSQKSWDDWYLAFVRTGKALIKSLILELLQRLPVKSTVLGAPKGIWRSTETFIHNSRLDSEFSNYIELYPAHTIHRLPPKSIYQETDWRFAEGYLGSQFTTPSAFVALLPKGRVYGENGTIISPDDRLIADLSIEFGVVQDNAEDHSIFKMIKLAKLTRLDSKVAVLAAAGGYSYFHWMFDVLPRIHLLQKSNLFSTIDKFVVNPLASDFQKETLEKLGIPVEKCLESNPDFHIQATHLIVPSLPGITGSMTQWACDFLRKTFLNTTPDQKNDKSSQFERLYISRALATRRRVLNEDEVMDLLSRFGFKILTMETLTVLEQAAVMATAEVVISLHGAALTNLVFCSPGCKVIEIFAPHYVNPCYRALCNLMNLDYWYLLGEGEPIPPGFKGDYLMVNGEADITININALHQTLEQLGVTGANRPG